MKRVAIIQARMTSTRLPGKVLLDLAGRPMLAQQLRRLRACRRLDAIWIATTTNRTDDPVEELARANDVGCFRGSEADVLGRYVGAATAAGADLVVRVTADCPLIDPGETDRVVAEIEEHRSLCDYCSNVLDRTYPRGLDVEAFWLDTLLRIDRLATSQPAREHVTLPPRSEQAHLFLTRSVTDPQGNHADLRWTVDAPADFALVQRLYADLDLGRRVAPYHEILAHVRAHPELAAINRDLATWTPTR